MAGAPVKKRDHGFTNDIAALNRLRTALRIDNRLPRDKVVKTLKPLDELVDGLAELHESVIQRCAAKANDGGNDSS